MQPQRQLRGILQEGRPNWTEKDLDAVEGKLKTIGVHGLEAFAEVLGDPLNAKLKDHGFKTLSSETVRALRRALESQQQAEAPAAAPMGANPVRFPIRGAGAGSPSSAASTTASSTASVGAATVVAPRSLGSSVAGAVHLSGEVRSGKGKGRGAAHEKLHTSAKELFSRKCFNWNEQQTSKEAQPQEQATDRAGPGMHSEAFPAFAPVARAAAPSAKAEREEEDAPLPEAEVQAVRERCRAKDIRLEQLVSPARAAAVLKQLEPLEKASAGTLKNEYKMLGFVPEAGMTGKDELLAAVKRVLVWRQLKLHYLRQVCRDRKLEVTEEMQRADLLALLANATWEARGVPLARLPSNVVAHGILDQVESYASRSLADLKVQCRKLEIPLEANPTKEALVARLRTVTVWKQLPAEELHKDCGKRGIGLSDLKGARGGMHSWNPMLQKHLTEESRDKPEMLRRLLQTLHNDMFEAAGIPVDLVKPEVAQKLFQEVEHLRAMDLSTLKAEYKTLNLPAETGLDRNDMIGRLNDANVFGSMETPELLKLCEERGVLSDELEGVSAEEKRTKLAQGLLEDSVVRAWEASKGIPAKRLGSFAVVAGVVEQINALDGLGTTTLRDRYTEFGLPNGDKLLKPELMERLSEVVVWDAMPIEELRYECGKLGCDLPPNPGDEEGERREILDRILLERYADTFEARGIPARRLRTFQSAASLAEQLEALPGLGGEQELRKQYAEYGLPAGDALERAELLERLREFLVWMALPVEELRVEFHAQALPGRRAPKEAEDEAGQAEERRALLDQILLERYAAIFEEMQVPALRLCSFQAASGISAKFVSLEDMSAEDLLEQYLLEGLPVETQLDKTELLKRLREYVVLNALPLAQLRGELGILDDDSKLSAEQKETVRADLLDSMLLDTYADAFEANGFPARQLGTFKAASSVAKQIAALEVMEPKDMRKQYLEHGLPMERELDRGDFLARLFDYLVLDALPLAALRVEVETLKLNRLPVYYPDEEAERKALLDQILMEKYAAVYEASLIPVKQLGSFKAAARLSEQWESLGRMNVEALRRDCKNLGLPCERWSRDSLLVHMRDAALWGVLPIQELRRVCSERALPVPAAGVQPTEAKERAALVNTLLLSACSDAYREMGIPVTRLGSVMAAANVAESWTKLATMTINNLLLKASALSIPAGSAIEKSELLSRLKVAVLWMELPFEELQKECRSKGVNSVAREGQRRELVARLAAALWAPKPTPPPPPPRGGPGPGGSSFPPQRPMVAAGKVAGWLRTLQLPMGASLEDVKKSYKRLALKHHPDKNQEATREQSTKLFREIAEAYEGLCSHMNPRGK